ncbi:MAG: hypothetical protein PHN64_04755 [Desulfovibrionaceae bacterium]|nr:hypothetical protein [Desulfovibrionaceae bacterium]
MATAQAKANSQYGKKAAIYPAQQHWLHERCKPRPTKVCGFSRGCIEHTWCFMLYKAAAH